MVGIGIVSLLLVAFGFIAVKLPRETEHYRALKIVLYLASGLLGLRIEGLFLPLGLLIAGLIYLRGKEAKPNRLLKRTALSFACVLYVVNSFLFPLLWTPVGSILDTWDRNQMASKLQGVQAMFVYAEDSSIQSQLSGILDANSSFPITSELIRGLYWVCLTKGIPVTDAQSIQEKFQDPKKSGLNASWSRRKKGDWVNIQTASGEQYLVVFKQQSAHSSYVSYVIEYRTAAEVSFWSMLPLP
ncbi:hypothetical protein [Gorillibacterium sp. sgz500922]|uniref:hypothetical protein n=1 Tax=Gorillibacterium sp. sgz500922 TaxID=3446694 RepID=UPI003F663DFB